MSLAVKLSIGKITHDRQIAKFFGNKKTENEYIYVYVCSLAMWKIFRYIVHNFVVCVVNMHIKLVMGHKQSSRNVSQ